MIPGRFKEWWFYKTPFLLCVTYSAAIINGSLPPLSQIALFLISYVGCSVYGYLMNDWCDRDVDRLAGKSNLLSSYSVPRLLVVVLVALSAGIIPWYFLPRHPAAYYLLAAELLLLTIYCLPPVRLKDRGIAAIVTDSLYGFVLPFSMSAILFFHKPVALVGVIGFLCFLITAGFRNILIHQLQDAAHDKLSNVSTIATKRSKGSIKRFLEQWLFPLEVLSYIVFSVALGKYFIVSFILFLLHVCFAFKRETKLLYERNSKLPDNYSFINTIVLDEFYQSWLPVFLLIVISLNIAKGWVLLVLHALVFYPQIAIILSDIVHVYYKAVKVYWYIMRRFYWGLGLNRIFSLHGLKRVSDALRNLLHRFWIYHALRYKMQQLHNVIKRRLPDHKR